MLCVFLIAAFFVDRSFVNPIRAEEAKPKAKAKSPPPAAPKAAEIRTETITYDTWTVTCRDTLDGKTRKICSAQLPMVAMQQNQQVPLGAWMIGRNNEGALLSIVQTPQLNVGVLISKGIEIKLGNANPQTISYSACNPQRCEGVLTMNEAVIREMSSAANEPAVISFWKADGDKFGITIPSIKGIDRVIFAIK
jgi:invasion protein IalB